MSYQTQDKKELRKRWGTPRYLFDQLNREYRFTVDICADEVNHKLPEYVTEKTPNGGGLNLDRWRGRVWCNPPYNNVTAWLRLGLRAISSGQAEIAVFLVPASVDTRWFDLACYGELHFFKSRIQFVPPPGLDVKNGCAFPSMLVVMDVHTVRGDYVDEPLVRRRDAKTGKLIEADQNQMGLFDD